MVRYQLKAWADNSQLGVEEQPSMISQMIMHVQVTDSKAGEGVDWNKVLLY